MNHISYYLASNEYLVVHGGPYRQRPHNLPGLKMAAESPLPCTISVPTKDFSVPSVRDVDAGLKEAVKLLLKGEGLYVGCMGGIGRTGLMLAILAKAFGYSEPVEYVRDNYDDRAVETRAQEQFVRSYRIPLAVHARIKAARFFALIGLRRVS